MFERFFEKFRGLSVKRRRIATLDLLRGFLLFVIILDHSPLSPRLTDLLSGGGDLIVSAAEGFFIISGILVGYLYAHKIILSTRSTVRKIWKRALILYSLSLATTLLFTHIGLATHDPTNPSHIYRGSFLDISFWQSLISLEYTYGWADFLSRYAVFMFFSPICLLLIAIKKSYVLAIASVLLWWISPIIGLQQFTAWQILFVFGMIAGSQLETILDTLKKTQYHLLLRGIVATFFITGFLSLYVVLIYPFLRDSHILPGTLWTPSDQLSDAYNSIRPYFDKETLGVGRIIMAGIWFIALFTIFSKYEKSIQKYTRGMFVFLGKNTLPIYVIHSGVIFFLCLIFTLGSSEGAAINTLVAIIALLLTLGLSRAYFYLQLKLLHHRASAGSRPESE